ncbi:hypothetical protein PF005_g7274 [Phytophthora fragariae]|uniref:Uncharacterized protein n=2 Tax=Phytophthora fragariae TaxID=53985 RepID=A0A6A3ZX48_9STRA|nr:hypothetical protein PF011_g6202 [Phytophthora fragariae]KAE9115089.1 hypothetical protein PF010_g9460 [Phytophthora fragariae]KAE9220998.1 hypothetical protein PF005_g7274 [Phytophthora fragariae]KAE9243041.1 hypothetical protein PF004_g6331 [Phytophthora fragariae]KAE9243170.1 hypothetical protein PF002_g8385 [Phytophthora fragariae]
MVEQLQDQVFQDAQGPFPQPVPQPADELWERLETTKRERGEFVEEWGDRVSDLCESLDYANPQMRYHLFRRGLRNKRMLATLDASPASDIPEACEWLMFKDMHRPIEEDDGFSEGDPVKKGKSNAGSSSVEALAQQLKSFMEQQQLWQQQLAQRQRQLPRSPGTGRGCCARVAAAEYQSRSERRATVPWHSPRRRQSYARWSAGLWAL